MLAVTAIALLRIQSLFVAAMLTGIYSLLSAALFVLLDAVDVAFTEAAVGAGITTVLFLGMLARIPPRPEQYRELNFRLGPLLVVLITGAALIYATHDMPAFGDPNAPANLHVAPRYINDSAQEVGPLVIGPKRIKSLGRALRNPAKKEREGQQHTGCRQPNPG